MFSFNWLIGLHYWFDFSHTSTWIHHRCTYIPSLLNPAPTPLAYDRAPVWVPGIDSKFPLAPCLHMLVCVHPCDSLHLSHPGPLLFYPCPWVCFHRHPRLVPDLRGNAFSFSPLRNLFAVGLLCVSLLVTQSCPTLCDPMDCSPTRLLCPWDSPGKNTGVGCHFLPQGIFPTQGWNLGLPHCRQTLYRLSPQGCGFVVYGLYYVKVCSFCARFFEEFVGFFFF